jgi:hypothetical protein
MEQETEKQESNDSFKNKYQKQIMIFIALAQIIFTLTAIILVFAVLDYRHGFDAGQASAKVACDTWRP